MTWRDFYDNVEKLELIIYSCFFLTLLWTLLYMFYVPYMYNLPWMWSFWEHGVLSQVLTSSILLSKALVFYMTLEVHRATMLKIEPLLILGISPEALSYHDVDSCLSEIEQ